MSQRGVTLIELIVVIVALSAGIALLGTAYLQAARTVATNEDIQLTWQVAQACADHTLARVRRPGAFSNVAVSSDPCSALPTNGTSRIVTVSTLAGGTEPCNGVGWTCRMVNVQVTRSGYTASLNFAFINY